MDIGKWEGIKGCATCVIGKATRVPFPDSTSKAGGILDLIHLDLCGPFNTSVGGKHYFATFVDNKSCVAWIFLLAQKSKLQECFKTF